MIFRFRTSIIPGLLMLIWVCSCRNDKTESTLQKPEKIHTLAGELAVMADLSRLPAYIDNTLCAQVSSYDTTGGNDDGFSGRYSYIKRNSDGSLIIFDVKGKGVINRIWTPTPSADTLDFFIDDTLKPVLSVCYTDLFSGKLYPFVEPLCGNQLGGFYCYLPVLFEKSCRIVNRGKLEQFHQIQYRLYGNEDKVRSFSTELNDEDKAALEKIKKLWSGENLSFTGHLSERYETKKTGVVLKPGGSSAILDLNSGGRILGITLSQASALEGLDRNTDIRITWDGEKVPAVYCPAADFFGFAFGSASMQSLLLGTRHDTAYCLIPMPFDHSAKIELIRRAVPGESTRPLMLNTEVIYSLEPRETEAEGKFYARWNRDTVCRPGVPHTIADIKGRGHFIGTILQAQGLKAGMTIFFEGDDSTSIDGVCRLHGTGSEDYFNGGWYALMDRWDDKMSLPVHGSLGYSLPFCRTGGYRFYISDKLLFSQSLYQSIEHGPAGNSFPSDYTSLGLYYCDSSPVEQVVPANELTRVYIPDTLYIYPQLTGFNIYGNLGVETTWKYGTGGESYTFTPGADSWLRMSLSEIPEGRYEVYFDIIGRPEGCDFSLWQRQKQCSGWISTAAVAEQRKEEIYVCDLTLPSDYKTVTLRFRCDKEKKSLLLNRIVLIRKHQDQA